MEKNILLERIQQLGKELQESSDNHSRIRSALENATNSHNILAGRLAEAQSLYDQKKLETIVS